MSAKQSIAGAYVVRCVCSNCGYRGSLTLPKGTPAPSHGLAGRATECPNCGCREYGKDL